MSELKLTAETRTEFGKGAARRLRREGQIPAVLYGHGSDPIHVSLPGHQATQALKQANALFELTVGSEEHLTIPRQVQRDPLRGHIEHVDLLIVQKGERVVVEVPLVHVGEAAAGTLVVTELATIALEVEATHIPESVDVVLDGLEAGALVHASDLSLPKGATLAEDAENLIVNITAAPTAAQMEHDGEGATDAPAAEEAAAEGE